ncbi:MAG: hypothetical protein JOY90_19895 [Bradyrhizobium sp.]|uniref:hypothetical protein n=1 Tax=Bradyrhizobium sp. TaxID=376 RepID=UPI001D49EBBD|nr:hypothetical protein [Bradyrhizobium sp.]MBV9562678.1 hypothetical protein [Bradyrhizobium sp.]
MTVGEGIEVVLGVVLVGLALRDVFDTVVVPGESKGALRVARRLLFAMLPVWKRMRRGKSGVSTSFAPSVLMASFVVWMELLLVGFGLVAHGLGSWFSPPADSFEQAAFIAGSALATVGLSGIEAHGPARWVLVASGLCGLAVLTMAVTYLIEVQEGIARRDAGVLKITTASGQPPSALGLLERYADLDAPEEMRRALYDGRDWCASVLQSHASHPSLVYFRSVGTGAGWPAALGTIMDLALIFELLIDDPRSRAAAVLLRDEGMRLVGEIAGLIGLEPKTDDTIASDVEALCGRLSAARYRLRPDADREEFVAKRREHARCIEAIAEHLGTPAAPLLS